MTIQPTIADLTARRMQSTDPVPTGSEVELHDASYGFRVDAGTAWADARYALNMTGSKVAAISMPAEWATFVATAEQWAVPLAPGFFPQQVRDLQPLLDRKNLNDLRPKGKKPATQLTSLRTWVGKHQKSEESSMRILAEMLACQLGEPTGNLTGNELACAYWQSGKSDEAIAEWESLPDGAVKSFNLGMGYLFTNQPKKAVKHLEAAGKALPDTTGWSHLAQLYLAIAGNQ